ncbi:MAG TPA: MGMT family protein [Candidatus Cloacimonadota bacterium]|nr:MGMT family protein [Candidatus Cloacimonadota bacterium]
MEIFPEEVIRVIKSIPKGKVLTYKIVASLAGNHLASRQVARILHSCSKKYKLPWHRVINSQGYISLPVGGGFEEQFILLNKEGVFISPAGRVDLKKYLWCIKNEGE